MDTRYGEKAKSVNNEAKGRGRLSSVETRKIGSWVDLARVIEECAADEWIFRGENEEFDTLQPKAGRVSAKAGSARKMPYDPAHEREALELFRKQARPHLGHTPTTDTEWLAIAQHYGMATRLLDWTESLLVAAYFATEKAGSRGDGVIYGVSGLRRISKEEEQDPFAIESPGIYRPPHLTPRIPAQSSVFTVHPAPTHPFVPDTLVRWVVSEEACAAIKHVLDACTINESTLFPGLDGLSRYIGWRYKWGRL